MSRRECGGRTHRCPGPSSPLYPLLSLHPTPPPRPPDVPFPHEVLLHLLTGLRDFPFVRPPRPWWVRRRELKDRVPVAPRLSVVPTPPRGVFHLPDLHLLLLPSESLVSPLLCPGPYFLSPSLFSKTIPLLSLVLTPSH